MKTKINLDIMDTASFAFKQLITVIRRCTFFVNKFSLYILFFAHISPILGLTLGAIMVFRRAQTFVDLVLTIRFELPVIVLL